MNSRTMDLVRLWLTPVAGVMAATASTSASELRLADIQIRDGQVNVQFASESGFYYILWHGDTLSDIHRATDTALGDGLGRVLSDTNLASQTRFYRAEKISVL